MIKIHHGPPGSYKTSGSIRDDFRLAVWEGRHVVTNVRGLTDREQILKVIDKHPPLGLFATWLRSIRKRLGLKYKDGNWADFDLTHVDCDSEAGREEMAKFWHWAPEGAFLQLDEIQRIWPKRATQSELRKLDLDESLGITFTNGENRPQTFSDAFDMHRHAGWDMVLTTPDISKIRAEIRGAADQAHLHTNLKGRGMPGWYIESQHDATDNGTSGRQFWKETTRRMPKWVFELYHSTATGEHRDTWGGFNLFKSPKMVGALSLMAVAIAWVIHNGKILDPEKHNPPAAGAGRKPAADPRHAYNASGVQQSGQTHRAVDINHGDIQQGDAGMREPLASFRITLSGVARFYEVIHEYVIKAGADEYMVTDLELRELGYEISGISDCLVKLKYQQLERLVFGCAPPEQSKKIDVINAGMQGGQQLADNMNGPG